MAEAVQEWISAVGAKTAYIERGSPWEKDLETMPDLGGFAAANDLIGMPDVEVREAIGDKFPKRIYHSIVCIGALVWHREPDYWAVDAVGAPHVGDAAFVVDGDLVTPRGTNRSRRRPSTAVAAPS